jgi:hypothetical protein
MGTAKGDAAHAAHSAEDPAPEAGMSRDVINIPDNVLLDGIKTYSQADQDDLLWLINWGQQELGSRERLCAKLQADWSTVIRVCTGKYGAGIASFMAKARDLRKKVAVSPAKTFIATCVTRKIWETLDYALSGDVDGGRMVMIVGHTRRGKSIASLEWARLNNHGTSVYVDCPESGGLKAMLQEIAKSCRINLGRKTADIRTRVIGSFNSRRILILDEILRELPTRGCRAGPIVLEFIRRLYDVRHCGVALLVTPAFAEELQTGALRDYLEQLVGRIEEPLIIPDKVLRQECQEIAAAYRASPPKDLVDLMHDVANEPGRLARLFYLLGQARLVAHKKDEPLSARHLLVAIERRNRRFQWPEEK